MSKRIKSRCAAVALLSVVAIVGASCASGDSDALIEAQGAKADAAAASAMATSAQAAADAAKAAADAAVVAAELAEETAAGNADAVADAESRLAVALQAAEAAQKEAADARADAEAAQEEASAARMEAEEAQVGAETASAEVQAAQEQLLTAQTQLLEAQAQATEAGGDLPFSHILNDGSTFTLNPRVARKVRTGETINYVFSYQSTGIPLFSDQYAAGFRETQQAAQRIYPMEFTSVAPVDAINIAEQIAQIEALYNTDQIDCLSIEPADSNAYTNITNELVADGIPVFTVGVTSNGNEFSNFTQVPMKEGRFAADLAMEFMNENGYEWDTFAVSGGDPAAFWAQGRMRGFQERILEVMPDATFITTYDDALQVGGGVYDPAVTYDDYRALLAGNPELDFIENVDIGAEHANRAIIDSGREGEVFTLGWNVSYGQLDGIESGIQVVALDQRWSEQAGFGALACAELFANGRILPNTQTLLPIQVDQVDVARADLDRILAN